MVIAVLSSLLVAVIALLVASALKFVGIKEQLKLTSSQLIQSNNDKAALLKEHESLKARRSAEISKLEVAHADEMTSLKITHAEEVTNLKAEIEKAKAEIGYMEAKLKDKGRDEARTAWYAAT